MIELDAWNEGELLLMFDGMPSRRPKLLGKDQAQKLVTARQTRSDEALKCKEKGLAKQRNGKVKTSQCSIGPCTRVSYGVTSGPLGKVR